MTDAWPARLSTNAASYLAALQPDQQEIVRDVLDIASRNPWGWPQWDETDPEGHDLRMANVGALTLVYWINPSLHHLHIIDIVWQ